MADVEALGLGFTISGHEEGMGLGVGVASAGDFDGDGLMDLMVVESDDMGFLVR